MLSPGLAQRFLRAATSFLQGVLGTAATGNPPDHSLQPLALFSFRNLVQRPLVVANISVADFCVDGKEILHAQH